MAKSKTSQKSEQKAKKPNPLRYRYKKEVADAEEPFVHIYHNGAVCETDTRGHSTPKNQSPTELVVDATNGFIPLWNKDVTLRWRFQPRAMTIFRDPEAAKSFIRTLFGEAILLWGDARPVKFTEAHDRWDFEIVVRAEEKCNPNGCTLASAFFPDAGQHELVIYPTMFDQSRKEQLETLAHEVGHIFGLRHFFADISERRWRSEIFGEHSPFSIMNYGPKSVMTETDRTDLKKLYQLAWNGELTEINGTPVRLMQPFSAFLHQFSQPDLIALRHDLAAARSVI